MDIPNEDGGKKVKALIHSLDGTKRGDLIALQLGSTSSSTFYQ